MHKLLRYACSLGSWLFCRVLHIRLSCSWSFSIAPHGAYTNMPGAITLANLSFIKVDVWWARFSFSRRLFARSRCLCHLRILLNENGSVPHFNIVLVFNSIYVLMWVDAVNTEIAFILDRYSPILFPAPCRTLFQQFFFFLNRFYYFAIWVCLWVCRLECNEGMYTLHIRRCSL